MGQFTTTGKLLILLSLLVFLVGVFSLFWEFPWENRTPFIEQGTPLKSYNQLIIRGPIHVTHITQEHPSLFISGKREDLDSTTVSEVDSTLTIQKPLASPHSPGRVFAELSGMPRRITLSRGSHFFTSSNTVVESMEFNVNNISTATISSHIESFKAIIKDRGHIHLEDTVETATVEVLEHGRFSVEGGHIGVLRVSHSSDEEIYIESADSITGVILGAGNIRFPEGIDNDIEVRGGGSIIIEGAEN